MTWLTTILSAVALMFGGGQGGEPEAIRIELPKPGARYGSVQIPRLRLNAPISAGARLRELAASVGHLESTYWPGMGGTVALFAHRVTPTLGLPHGPFRYIDRLRPGHRIVVTMPYGRYVYRVTGHRVVHRKAWKAFRAELGEERLLIAACHPPGSAAQRYVVIAERA